MDYEMMVAIAIGVPLLGTVLAPLAGRLGKGALAAFAVVMAFIGASGTVFLLWDMWMGSLQPATLTFQWAPSIELQFSIYIDPLGAMMAFVAGCIGALVVLYSVKYMEGSPGLSRYYALVLLFIGSMVALVFVDNLLILYFFWEIIGLCSCALIGFNQTDPKAAKAGIKAFVVTRVGDIALLIAIFALYVSARDIGATVSDAFSIQWLIAHSKDLPMVTLGGAGLGFIIGAMGKSAQVPLHVWLPDAMEAPTTVSALIHAATLVNSGVYLILRTMPLFGHIAGWGTLLMAIGAMTALLAATMAAVEPDLKRLLAYSTVSQLGFMVFAAGLIEIPKDPAEAVAFAGLAAAGFHLFSHAIFKALLFLGAGAVIHSAGTRNMYQMGGLGKEMRITYVTMLVGAMSLAGLIGLSGFWSKDMILEAAWESHNYFPLAIMVLTALLTALYSFRMLNLVFWGESRRDRKAHDAPMAMAIPLVLLAAGAIISWLSIGLYTGAMHAFQPHEPSLSAHFYHGVEVTRVADLVARTFGGTAIYLSLAAFFGGLALWYFRKHIVAISLLQKPVAFVRAGYGFNTIYDGLMIGLREVAMKFRRTHTGDLNLNLAAIAVAILVMAAALFLIGGV
jgi:NADH-quinone oxidoreductase subunit L